MSFVTTVLFFVVWTWTVQAKTTTTTTTLRASTTSSRTLTCRITLMNAMERKGNEGTTLSTTNETACIPIVDGVESSTLFAISIPEEIQQQYHHEIQTGGIVVALEGALISGDQVTFSKGSSMRVVEATTALHDPIRRLITYDAMDVRKVLVIRITMSSGEQVGYSAETIRDYLFVRDDCMAMKMKGCLNGNIELKLVDIFEVTVPGKTSDFLSPSEIRNKAVEILVEREGISSLTDLGTFFLS
eukprot:scaffold7767_cov149-Amphora_coffeaeformis.AAC.5